MSAGASTSAVIRKAASASCRIVRVSDAAPTASNTTAGKAGIWARLYALPQYDDGAALMQDLPEAARATAVAHAPFTHVLTHRDLDIHVVSAGLPRGAQPPGDGRWYAPADWPALGLPAPVRRFLERQAIDTP